MIQRNSLFPWLGLMASGVSSLVFLSCATQPKLDSVAFRDGVRQTVLKNQRDLMECYEAAIDERPGAEGRMILEWEVLPDGSVQNLQVVEVDPKITMATECVSQKLRNWVFASHKHPVPVLVTYPFIFTENGRYTPPEK